MKLRQAVPDDADRLAEIHATSRATAMPWLPVVHTPAEDKWFFRHIVIPDHNVEVCEADDQIIGFIAITDTWLHHLYIDPAFAGQGIGTGLLQSAMARRKELRLWVFQRNARARAFYAKNGFSELELTDGDANEEKMPDVLMHWRAG